ncbi:tetratricopeptide repeat protein [Sphingomonas sp.]|uniref:tetratricopeptide repeat protein n=1 Tax=Sphingomonas sp. TaxID=28214 RepID=UPI002FC91030
MRARLRLFLPLALFAACCPPAAAADATVRAKLEKLAAERNPQAAYHLGMIYHLGLGGAARDPAKAFELFKQAAEGGDPLGAYKIGCYYAGQGEGVVAADPALALRHKLVAAEAGYALAQFEVAQHYLQRGDREEGLRWLEAAARQGSSPALLALGSYHSGRPFADARDGAKYYAYTLLSLAGEDDETRAFAAELKAMFATGLSEQERAGGEKIIASWRAEPTPLTLRANAGQKAAEALVAARD